MEAGTINIGIDGLKVIVLIVKFVVYYNMKLWVFKLKFTFMHFSEELGHVGVRAEYVNGAAIRMLCCNTVVLFCYLAL